jgi:hypothetical protein
MSLPHPDINIGAPPLLWSDVYESFKKINANFDSIAASLLGGGGGSIVNFGQLFTDVSPSTNNTYRIGSLATSWKSLFTTEWSSTPGNENNGIWLGNAQMRGISGTVDLPANSTVSGNLIIDPSKTAFKFISVPGQQTIEADDFTDLLTFLPGPGINILTNPAADTIQVNNLGVLSLSGTPGQIAVDNSTGNITITNLGVTSLTAGTTIAGRTPGTGISVNNPTGNISITNTGIIDVQPGFGITVFKDNITGIVTVTNTSPAPNVFGRIRVTGNNDLVADSTGDTLVIEAGYGMDITTSETVDDTLFIGFNNRVDIIGSVFADDSTLMIDAVNGIIVAPVEANVVGNVTGDLTGNVTGNLTGNVTGDLTGSVFADDSTLMIDAVNGIIVAPVEANVVGNVTGDLTGNVVGTLTGNVIGDVTGNLNGIVYGDLIGSVFSETSTLLIDATDGLIKGDVVNNVVITNVVSDNSGSSTINIGSGILQIGSSNNIEIFGAAGSNLFVGGGTGGSTSGDVYLGNGSNQIISLSKIYGNIQGDVTGSVFGDDSSLIIDAINNRHFGDFIGSLEGNVQGNIISDDSSVIVDHVARRFTGNFVGDIVGSVFADNSSLIIDAIGNNIVTNSIIGAGTKLRINSNKINIAGGTPYVPGTSVGSPGDESGDIAFDATSIYFCIGNHDGVSDIWVKQDWSTTGSW